VMICVPPQQTPSLTTPATPPDRALAHQPRLAGPYHGEQTLAVFFAAVKALQPVGVILAGDILDCKALSHFSKDPMDPRSLADEIRIVREMMAELAPIPIKVFGEGNHCRCLVTYLHCRAPELACLPELELPNLLHCQAEGWLYLPYGHPYELGNALVVHGSKVAQHSGQSAMKHVQSLHRSVIHGHTHRAGSH
jgi:hypothetical protein